MAMWTEIDRTSRITQAIALPDGKLQVLLETGITHRVLLAKDDWSDKKGSGRKAKPKAIIKAAIAKAVKEAVA